MYSDREENKQKKGLTGVSPFFDMIFCKIIQDLIKVDGVLFYFLCLMLLPFITVIIKVSPVISLTCK